MTSLASHIRRTPRPFELDRGQDALAACAGLHADLHPLVLGAAGCSPYLAGLIAKESAWLCAAVDDPHAAVTQEIAAVATLTPETLSQGLRIAKRRIALMTGLADLAGAWPLETVTQTLTDFANAAVHQCITTLVAQEAARGKLPGISAEEALQGGGMVALAMGKMGAGELNYSSDIDLICLFDETRFAPDDYHDARASFIRVTRRMTALLSDNTAEGYVFRTDLRLRPDASVTPVCLSMEAAERYYESVGRTWERGAYIKAAPSGGDRAAGARFLETLRPFVWRKHLDFAAIQDAHDMRLRIRDHKGLGGPQALEGHNMKLGRGGIREIEFFTQTRQLIAGGRDESLRARGTVAGLAALTRAGWVPEETTAALTDHYRAHREVEHRLQMINDAQTHDLPPDDAGFARLAAMMDRDVADLRREITTRLDAVHHLTEGFFAPDAAPARPKTLWGADVTARWPTYPALRSERAGEIFERLRPVIMDKLAASAKPDEALAQFDGFLAGLPAGVQLFSLFEANPQLSQLIVDICATAPALAQYLSRNAGVFDAVLGGAFFGEWPGAAELATDARRVLEAAQDYETQLIALRRWMKEWHFRIGVHHLRGLIDAAESGRQYADLAAATVQALWPVVHADFARKHGAAPGRGAAVVAMGSLAARQMGATSDLDLIVIYDPADDDASDGRRPLAVRPYYARLTQAMVTALSAQMAEGRLYEVDMRLRPSGRQGPVATSLASFTDYQMHEAWTWEHLALTRARAVAGPEGLCADITATIARVLTAHQNNTRIPGDLSDMRQRIAAAKQDAGPWDTKLGAGRLQDCELFAQSASLKAGVAACDTAAQLAAGVKTGWLTQDQADAVLQAARLMWKVQATARLLTGTQIDPDAIGAGGTQMVLRETGQGTIAALLAEMETAAASASAVIAARLAKED